MESRTRTAEVFLEMYNTIVNTHSQGLNVRMNEINISVYYILMLSVYDIYTYTWWEDLNLK